MKYQDINNDKNHSCTRFTKISTLLEMILGLGVFKNCLMDFG